MVGFLNFFKRIPSRPISQVSISKTVPKFIQSFDFTQPLPFKTIEQQQAEFIPQYKYLTETVSLGKYPNTAVPEAQANISHYLQRGYTLEVQQVTRRGRPYGVYLNFSRQNRVQTNVFNPRLTRI